MSFEEEEESFEHTLLVVREVSVYKIPPRSTSGGYKCGEWLQSDKIWTGRLRVVSSTARQCEIRLEDPTSGDLFAACFVTAGARDASVETVLDSSRYFVLKIEDGQGKHAFVGLGFAERNEAFDFNVALSDHEKYLKRDHDKDPDAATADEADGHIDIHPAVNHRLKEGETIRINVKPKPVSGTGMLSAAAAKPKAVGTVPPLESGKVRSPLLPPPNDPSISRISSGIKIPAAVGVLKSPPKDNGDSLSDLSPLERSLPSATGSGSGSGSTKTTAAGWAAF